MWVGKRVREVRETPMPIYIIKSLARFPTHTHYGLLNPDDMSIDCQMIYDNYSRTCHTHACNTVIIL